MEWIGWDRLLFATDYPHWDFDDPARGAAACRDRTRSGAILFHDNAAALYGLA